ncbi:MAG TPA: ribose-phosphate pyrophosphokinase [Clostridia bacterium]|jgi:ribose-phosphate pyrophosphokinase|nr:ribose-phosphate pyrophosphokinase [Clostridia bacterium]HQO55489.1 ribose-phosphate pyrophosphokinase [Clostridia bacterium]HUM60688.1 ribose-phosphate pyrophosphokinase [Clostridia bacterium]
MENFLSEWDQTLSNMQYGPLGIIAMQGIDELGRNINNYLLKWHELQDLQDEEYYTSPGKDREDFLIDAVCPRFGTGEGKGVIRESVRGFDIYILVDVCAYNIKFKMYDFEVPMSPDDHFQDLKRVIAAIAGKAKRVNVIMPMLYESRQHRRNTRESLDCAIALQELENMGVANIITFDAHDPRVMNAVPLCGFENVLPTYQMLKALLRSVKDLHIDKENMMVVSPDEGAVQRNIYYSSVLSLELGMFYKRRDYTTVIAGRNPIVAHEYLGASVEGKDIIVADDILSSGESLLDLARELKKRKAKRIFCVVTYAFFTNGIQEYEEAYQQGIISRVIATNLTYRTPELKAAKWFAEADMSKYISYLIATLNHDRSLSALLNPYNRIQSLLARYRAEQAASGISLI